MYLSIKDEENNPMAQNTDAAAGNAKADPRELMLHGVKDDAARAVVMKRHLDLEERGDERAMDAAILINHSPMNLLQRITLTNLILEEQAPSSEEQAQAVQRFIDRVQGYLSMEDEPWDEFLAVGSRTLMRRITKPLDAELGAIATEILGEPVSTKIFAFDLLSHMGMDDELAPRDEELFTPRELLSQEMDLASKGALRELLTILSTATLGAVQEDVPLFEFLTEEWEEVQRGGVGIYVHVQSHEMENTNEEELLAQVAELVEGNAPSGGGSHEGENEQASEGPEEEAEVNPWHGLYEVPLGAATKHREQLENMGEFTVKGFAVSGQFYPTSEWNHVLEQVPSGSEGLLASFAREALVDAEALRRMAPNARYLTWEKLLQVAELSRDFSVEWAMAVVEWGDEE